MALSVEASELVELFQWLTPDESAAVMATDQRDAVMDEVADVMTYLLRLTDVLGIDLDEAMTAKSAANATRYPVATAHGSAAKAGARPAPAAVAPARSFPLAAAVLGVDGCAAGWVGALMAPGTAQPQVLVAQTVAALFDLAGESAELWVVAIDIPIGLPDHSLRQADTLARRALPGKASSVFTTLTRAAYGESDRAGADAVNRALTGQGVGSQAFALTPKILDVDAWVRSAPGVPVIDVHPEVSSLAWLARRSPRPRSPSRGGRRGYGLSPPPASPPGLRSGKGYAVDDVIDACAAAWTAARWLTGDAHSLPDEPEVFSDGLPAAIWV